MTKKRSSVAGRPRDPAADEAILQTAFDLFIEHGLEGANFEQIAKRSGVARATIYRRWRNKEELLVAALRQARRRKEEHPDVISELSVDALIDHLSNLFTETLMNPDVAIFAARLIGSLPDHSELLAIYSEECVEPLWRAISRTLEKARLTCVLPHLPDQELLLPILSGALMHRLLTRKGIPVRAKERKWIRSLLHYVGLAKTKSAEAM